MTRRTLTLLLATFASAALIAGACTSSGSDAADTDETTGNSTVSVSQDDMEAVATHYADGVFASYGASIASAIELQDAVEEFLTEPSDATLAAAKQQWLDARTDYTPTEAFRFYDGPIDDPDDGPEGRINAWPMDEAYVDYVEGDDTTGIIMNAADYPEITEEVVVSANEDGGETNISTGWHAIEFLLWGQDMSETGPGERPVTDYTSSETADRRATYLRLVTDLLVSDLESVAVQWDPDGEDNYRSEFLSDPEQAISNMFRGIGALTVGELSGERIAVAIETKDQEDEHSCFSDSTNADIVGDIIGTQWVYEGTYPGIDDGPGLDTLVEQVDADTDVELTAQMEDNLEMAENLPTTFDQMIAGDSSPLQDLVDGLQTQGELIATGAAALDIEVDTGV